MLINFIVLLLLMQCSGQDMENAGVDEAADAEVADQSSMDGHHDHQEMNLPPDGHFEDQQDDSMVMMASQPMLMRPAPIPMVQVYQPPPPMDSVTNKEQFCLAQMTKCLANPQPVLQQMMMEPSSHQQNGQASEPEGVTVDPPPSHSNEYEPVATGVNMGTIIRTKKRPHSLNLGGVGGIAARCSSQNFIRMHQCCSNSPTEFFNGAILYACADMYPVNPGTILKEYNLNLGQLPDNTIDLSSSDTYSGEILGNGVCFMDCIFKKRFMISDEGAIDYSMVAHHFMTSVTSRPWQPVVMQAIRNCSQIMHSFPTKMKNPEFSYQRFCNTHPYLFTQCVRKSLLMNCPVPNQRTESSECIDKRSNLQRCEIFTRRQNIPRF